MSRVFDKAKRIVDSFPRVSGDEPREQPRSYAPQPFSPRERG